MLVAVRDRLRWLSVVEAGSQKRKGGALLINMQRQMRVESSLLTPDRVVSVIIPCYNQGRFLGEAIESVLTQTWPYFEIIVVDDGSNDNTSKVAQRYPRARCIRQANQGLSRARNTGLRVSKGPYVVFLDADDRLLPNALEIGLEYLKVHPECAFVSGKAKLIGGNEAPLGTEQQPCIGSDHYLELLRNSSHIWNPPVSVYRRDVLECTGGYDPSVVACEDYELNLRITRSFPVYCHENLVAEYRIHEQNMSQNAELMLKAILAVYRLQVPYIKGHRGYEQAYAIGRRRDRDSYGNQFASQVSARVKAGELRQGLRGMLVLLGYYPKGFVRHTCPKLYCAVSRVKDASWNATANLTRIVRRQSTGWIKARPNPVEVCDASGLGVTTLSWASEETEMIEVRIGAPDGALFSRTGPSGSATTGKWVRGGMVFYLQDVSEGKPLTSANTLSTVTVNNTANIALHILEVLARRTLVRLTRIVRRQSTGWIKARPNPVEVCDASGLGVTTLSWASEETEMIEVRIGAPDGALFSRTGPSGSATTGKWVRGGIVFYLRDVSGGEAAHLGKHTRYGQS